MHTAPETTLRRLFDRAVAVADPMQSLAAHLPPKPTGRVVVIGAGKASARMAEAARQAEAARNSKFAEAASDSEGDYSSSDEEDPEDSSGSGTDSDEEAEKARRKKTALESLDDDRNRYTRRDMKAREKANKSTKVRGAKRPQF